MNKHVKDVCKIGQGNDCCRYLMVGMDGFECAKNTELKHILDNRVEKNTITSRGDNCEGKEIKDLN